MVIKSEINQDRIRELFCLFCLFIFFEPPLLSMYSQLMIVSKAFGAIRYFIGILSFLLVIFKAVFGNYRSSQIIYSVLHKQSITFIGHNNYTTAFFILVYAVLLNLILIVASYNNLSIYFPYILSCISKIGFVAYNIDAFHKMRWKLFRCYAYFLAVYCTINMMLQLAVPSGFFGYGDAREWLLGRKNGTTLYLLLDMIALAALYQQKRNRKIILLMRLINLCSVINRSSTAIIVIFLMDIVICFQMFRKKSLIVTKTTMLIAFIFIWLFFYSVIYHHEELGITLLITKIMGKSPTFSGRVAIWKLAIKTYEKNKLWGAGIGFKFHPWSDPEIVVNTAHNSILEFMCKYGIFSAVTFCAIMVAIFFQCLTLKNRKHALLCCGCVVALFLAMMFEAQGNTYLFWAIVLIPFLLTDRRIKTIRITKEQS